MTLQTPRHSFPYIQSAQAQKHITHNQALQGLDACVNCAVLNREVDTPPANVQEGDCVIVGATPAEEFADFAGRLAAFQNGAWEFYPIFAGFIIYDRSDAASYIYDGAAWQSIGGGERVSQFGINADADTTNRLVVKSPAVLLSADDTISGDMRLAINRASNTDVASVIFQTNYTGLVETGMMGDGAYRIKISPDGQDFSSALEIDPQTGFVGIGTSPTVRFDVSGDETGSDTALRIAHPGNANSEGAAIVLSSGGGTASFRHSGTNWTFLQTSAPNLIIKSNDANASQKYLLGNKEVLRLRGVRAQVYAPLRLALYDVASLPSASGSGSGSIVFVTDAAGGASLAISDGSAWLKLSVEGSVT